MSDLKHPAYYGIIYDIIFGLAPINQTLKDNWRQPMKKLLAGGLSSSP